MITSLRTDEEVLASLCNRVIHKVPIDFLAYYASLHGIERETLSEVIFNFVKKEQATLTMGGTISVGPTHDRVVLSFDPEF